MAWLSACRAMIDRSISSYALQLSNGNLIKWNKKKTFKCMSYQRERTVDDYRSWILKIRLLFLSVRLSADWLLEHFSNSAVIGCCIYKVVSRGVDWLTAPKAAGCMGGRVDPFRCKQNRNQSERSLNSGDSGLHKARPVSSDTSLVHNMCICVYICL